MAILYADEDFYVPVAEELRLLGHDVVCVHEVGRKGNPDPDVLAYAVSQGRAVLTCNHKDAANFIAAFRLTAGSFRVPAIRIPSLWPNESTGRLLRAGI